MELIAIADDKLINAEHIVSVEKKGKTFKIKTIDGNQHIVENNVAVVMGALTRMGVATPKQFWAG